MRTYWQIAAGEWGRYYHKEFLKFGMAFVGGETQIATMENVRQGDIVVLKRGTKEILAVAKVIQKDGKHRGCGDKEWLRDFDGWDLKAYCYVDCKQPVQPVRTTGLTRATIQKIHKQKHKDVADKILNTGIDVAVTSEPEKTRPIEDTEILKFLVKEGLRPSSADDLTNTISRIRLLADYYYNFPDWREIREHETRTFLVVPLLLALGWSEQQIKIELPCSRRKRIDIACFRKSYSHERIKDDCVAIIETKGFSSGLDYGQEQAKSYSKDFPNCKVIIVTNGYCYKIYLRVSKRQFEKEPSAYINLLKPKYRYPIDPENVGGALDAIKWLLPNNLI